MLMPAIWHHAKHVDPGMQVLLPEVGDVGFKQAMQQKWLSTDKSGGEPKIVRKVRYPACMHACNQ